MPEDDFQRGCRLELQGERGAAIEAYRRALENDAEHPGARRNLGYLLSAQGYALQERGEYSAAAASYQEALALEPAQPLAHNNLGNALRDIARLTDAIESYRNAIALDPGMATAHANLGIALQQTGQTAGATEQLRVAVALDPGNSEAVLNLGYLLEQQGDGRGALENYRKAIEIQPDFAEAHFNYALQLLLAGELTRGWAEYEWRLRHPDLARFWPFAGRPRWDGCALDGKTILLYAEQGFGDALQFVRYAPLVAARGAKVIVSCQAKLASLFRSVPGVAAVVDAAGPVPQFDLCCSLLSLPHFFGTVLETIPAQVPYVHADEQKARRWKAQLEAQDGRLKVGLFWATDTITSISASRSLQLDRLAALGGIPGAAFYSLQRGAAARQALRPPPGLKLIDCTTELRDFSDDAALIANLDLVISINSATAHLAGALGRPVWTLIQFPPDWRWLLERTDNPWYPSMRLFRRARDEPWERVAARLAEALRGWCPSS